jgi:hypothetical protein
VSRPLASSVVAGALAVGVRLVCGPFVSPLPDLFWRLAYVLRGADGIIHNHDRREDERDLVSKVDRCTVVRIIKDTEGIVGSGYN